MSNYRTLLLAGAATLSLVSALPSASMAQVGTTYIQPSSSKAATAAAAAADAEVDVAKKELALANKQADEAQVRHNANDREAFDATAQAKLKNSIAVAEAHVKTAQAKADLAHSKATAQNQSGGTSSTAATTTIPNSDSNYLDDHLMWNTKTYVYARGSGGSVDLSKKYCLDAKRPVIGLSSTFTSATPQSTDDDGKAKTQAAANYLPVKLDAKGVLWIDGNGADTKARLQSDSDPMCAGTDDTNALNLNADTEFYVAASDLDNVPIRAGWDFGTLVVPFKFELSGKNAIQSSATVGAYLGYRMPINLLGLTFRPVAFAGLSQVPTSDPSSGKSQTVAGLSYGFGLLTTVKDSFNIGLVVGADHVDSAQHYAYQDHPWISLEIGYSFTK